MPANEEERKANAEVDRYRQDLAKSLDPDGVNTPTGTPEPEPDPGIPVATQGDVRAFTPRRGDDQRSLTVPIEITNCGSERTFYKVTVTVSGASYRATAQMETEVTGVYPGTTWPTELVVRDPQHNAPDLPKVEISVQTRS
ncbi:hypothetical protein [Streptomyces sp. NRRL S-241]|uniref:hypothetical protein n=1 Tax=Streptomyces sp. NRRL S-241 TaxID=1463896 RepID=UPI00131EBDBD|nr:hypothetical protein [Streptomyces sp. NRRL S-241]